MWFMKNDNMKEAEFNVSHVEGKVVALGVEVIWTWWSLIMLVINLMFGLLCLPTYNIILRYIDSKPTGLQSPMDIPTAWLCQALRATTIGTPAALTKIISLLKQSWEPPEFHPYHLLGILQPSWP